MKAELLFFCFLIEHTFPMSTAYHAAKLFRKIFPDSKIKNKYQCGHMKTTHIVIGAVAKQITSDLKGAIVDSLWYGLATDGSSDVNDKLLPVLLTHVDEDSGLTAKSLLDIPNINSGSTVRQLYDVRNEVREAFSLDWDHCITYSSDNANSMTGQRNSLLQEMRSVQGDQIFLTLVSTLLQVCKTKKLADGAHEL